MSRSWTTLAAGAKQFVVQLGVADDVMRLCVVATFVHAEDDRDVLALCRGTDDHLLCAGRDVCGGLVGVGEQARRLEDDVDAEVAPGQSRGIFLLEDLDLAAVDDQRVFCVIDGPVVGAIGRIVLEQERIHRCVDEVVDRDDLDVRGPLDERLERLAADPPEAVDADSHCHDVLLRDPALAHWRGASSAIEVGVDGARWAVRATRSTAERMVASKAVGRRGPE